MHLMQLLGLMATATKMNSLRLLNICCIQQRFSNLFSVVKRHKHCLVSCSTGGPYNNCGQEHHCITWLFQFRDVSIQKWRRSCRGRAVGSVPFRKKTHDPVWGLDCQVVERTNNHNMVKYINKQDRGRSVSLLKLSKNLQLWALKHLSSLRALYLPGLKNRYANRDAGWGAMLPRCEKKQQLGGKSYFLISKSQLPLIGS